MIKVLDFDKLKVKINASGDIFNKVYINSF